MRLCRRLFAFSVPPFLLGVSAPAALGQATEKEDALMIRTVPTRPDLISGGDARVVIGNGELHELKVTLNDTDVSGDFAMTPTGAEGVVRGLRNGENNLVASARGHKRAKLTIVNHPLGGPIFSGPQLQPWICATPQSQPESDGKPATSASGLSQPAFDAQCDVKPEYAFYYRTSFPNCAETAAGSSPCFKPYDPKDPRPLDMARTTTSDGIVMDYVVRVERGAVNRGLYDAAVLFDPSGDGGRGMPAWNHKIVWSFGGGTGAFRRQTPPPDGWVNDDALAQGYMSVVSNLTAGSHNSNRVVAAETVLMLKEYISDNYGLVRRTIGQGCSAGSMQQITIATMYPGLLDGLMVSCSFPDTEMVLLEAIDSLLLSRYFGSEDFKRLNPNLDAPALVQKKTAITGHKDMGTLQSWSFVRPLLRAGVYGSEPMSNNCKLPNAIVYDPIKNPDGIRCAAADHSIAIWGSYPGTHIGRTYVDNVGIQYGLRAFLSGKIGAEDFVQLNEKVGGIDRDGEFVSQRSEGDDDAIRIAYRSGLVSDGHILAATPIFDLRGEENSGVHSNWNSFALRERLRRANGNADNYVLWRAGLAGAPSWTSSAWRATGMPRRSLALMDHWLEAVQDDPQPGTMAEKVSRNRPTEAYSLCYLGTDFDHPVMDEARCNSDPMLAYYSSIRQQAGGPLSSDILKCQLRPMNRADYGDKLSDEQFRRLEAVFPNGVCDWNRPGVGQQPAVPWLSFATRPGGVPLERDPGSRDVR